MKGTYGIIVAFVALWAAVSALEFHSVCPYPEKDNTTTNLAHENECTSFYKCHVTNRIKQLCPLMIEGNQYSRLHYNIFEQVCDWPWDAGCASCPPKNPRTGRYPPRSSIADERNSCDHYYICDNGVKRDAYCRNDECFSRTCQGCVPRGRQVGGWCTGDWVPTGTTPTSPTTEPPCWTGNRRDHECDCAKYYQCYSNTDWILQQCDGGLHYSPTEKTCMTPDRAGCLIPNTK